MRSEMDDNEEQGTVPEDTSAAPTEVEAGRTKFGKPLTIRRLRNGQMFVIDMADGGQKPNMLEGKFTRYQLAEEKIKAYEAQKKVTRSKSKTASK